MRISDVVDWKHIETPSYVFDIDALKNRMAVINTKKPENVKICYAMKANPFLIAPLSECVDAFEVCSPGELEICRHVGVEPDKVVFSGVKNARKK